VFQAFCIGRNLALAKKIIKDIAMNYYIYIYICSIKPKKRDAQSKLNVACCTKKSFADKIADSS
jgi:hypothetical protein